MSEINHIITMLNLIDVNKALEKRKEMLMNMKETVYKETLKLPFLGGKVTIEIKFDPSNYHV